MKDQNGLVASRCAQFRNENGATAVEYALIASLIAAAIVAVVLILGEEVVGLFQTIAGQF